MINKSLAIIFFGRYPDPGKCKTRLARTLFSTEENFREAAALYRLCCERTIRRFIEEADALVNADFDEAERVKIVFACADAEDVPRVKEWICSFASDSDGVVSKTECDDNRDEVINQCQDKKQRYFEDCESVGGKRCDVEVRAQDGASANLGTRMILEINKEFDRFDCDDSDDRGSKLVAVIGTDYPDASMKLFRRQHRLQRRRTNGTDDDDDDDDKKDNMEFGEAKDGGFWFVSSRKRVSLNAFDGVRWSTINAREDAMKAVELNNNDRNVVKAFSASEDEALYDIDTLDDLRKWFAKAEEASDEDKNDLFYSLVRAVIEKEKTGT